MKKNSKRAILGIIGGLMYAGIEILWRGHTHWTMVLCGGICFILIGEINEIIPWEMPVWQQAAIGTIIITAIEFAAGCIVNIWLKWGVWDYSTMPGNLLGQVCIPYILLWIPVSMMAIFADDWLRYWIFKEERPHYIL